MRMRLRRWASRCIRRSAVPLRTPSERNGERKGQGESERGDGLDHDITRAEIGQHEDARDNTKDEKSR